MIIMYELENARQLVTGFAKRNASVPQLKVSYYNHKFLKKIENKISLILIFVFISFLIIGVEHIAFSSLGYQLPCWFMHK